MNQGVNQRRTSFLNWMKRNDYRVSDISKRADMPYTTVDSFVKRPTAKMLGETEALIAEAFNTTVDEIFGANAEIPSCPTDKAIKKLPAEAKEPANSDKVQVMQLDIRFGMGGGAHYDAPVEAKPMSFSKEWLRQITSAPPDRLFWASGFGDSMYPTIGDRDIVLVDCSQVEPRIRDQIWALNQYGQGMIKRLKATADGYMIVSDNPSVAPEMAADGSMEIVGRVIAVVRRL